MAVIHWQEEHYAHSDIELHIERQSNLVSYCTAPHTPDSTQPYSGLVLVLHGYGSQAADGYLTNLRGYLAEKYNLLAIVVDYHASRLHPVNCSKNCAISRESYQQVLQYLTVSQREFIESLLIQSLPGWLKVQEGGLDVFLDLVNQNEHLSFSFKLIADNLDHQNFGLLQALDILTVLHDLSQKYSFDKNNIVAFGASHGGYLAHLCAKLAPNTFRGVIESSSYPHTPLYLISNQSYSDITPYFGYGSARPVPLFFDTPWELRDSTSPYFFGQAPNLIRDLKCSDHWKEVMQKSNRLCQFRMMHSSRDEAFQSISDKRKHVETLSDAGFDVIYKEMTQKDIDGKLVKNLDHGMGSSMRAIFDMYYPTLYETSGELDCHSRTVVNFLCGEEIYCVDHGNRPMLGIIPSA